MSIFEQFDQAVSEVFHYLEVQSNARDERIRLHQAHLQHGAFSKPIARLAIEVNGLEQLPSKVKLCIVVSDNRKQKTEVVLHSSMFNLHKPQKNATFFLSFPVFDPFAQLEIRIYEMPGFPILPPHYIGAAVLPIPNIIHSTLNSTSVPAINVLLRSALERVFHHCAWLELYPLPEETSKYGSMLEDLVDIGLEKPSRTLGFVHVHTELSFIPQSQTEASSRYSGGAAGSLLTAPVRVVPERSPPDYVWWELVRNVIRIRMALQRPLGVVRVLERSKSWESPVVSILVGLWVFTIVAWIRLSLVPVAVVLSVGLAQLCMRAEIFTQEMDEARPWKQQVRNPADKTVTPIGEALKWQYALARVQNYLDSVASIIERAHNSLNWLDAPIALVSYTAMLILACISGILITILQWIWVLLPRARLVLAVTLVSLILWPSQTQSNSTIKDESKNQEMPRKSIPSPQKLRPEQEPKKEDIIGDTALMNLISIIQSVWRRYSLRVPDERELMHRYICAKQATQSAPGLCSCKCIADTLIPKPQKTKSILPWDH